MMGPKGFGQVGESQAVGCSRGCDKMCGSSRAPTCGASGRTDKFGRELPDGLGGPPGVTSHPGVWGPFLPKNTVMVYLGACAVPGSSLQLVDLPLAVCTGLQATCRMPYRHSIMNIYIYILFCLALSIGNRLSIYTYILRSLALSTPSFFQFAAHCRSYRELLVNIYILCCLALPTPSFFQLAACHRSYRETLVNIYKYILRCLALPTPSFFQFIMLHIYIQHMGSLPLTIS
jgi:hypothetical protein